VAFWLIIGDREDWDGNIVPAIKVCKTLMDMNLWYLYPHTPNRKAIRPNDNLLVYIAGRCQYHQCFVAKARLEKLQPWDKNRHALPYSEFDLNQPESVMHLKQVTWLPEPVHVGKHRRQLDVCKNKDGQPLIKWGCRFTGGMRKIPDRDFRRILKLGKAA